MEGVTTETIKDKKKSEILIQKAKKVGNFSYEEDQTYPKNDIFVIDLDEIADYVQYLPFLPDGYGFTGGVARGALLGLLGEKIPRYRDIDIEGVRELGADKDMALDLANKYMDEYETKPVGINEDLVSYFSTRDFTINEVFLEGNQLYFSRQAVEDMEDKVIRPTWFEQREVVEGDDNYERGEDRYTIRPKLLMKALIMQVEFIKNYGRGTIEEVERWQWIFDKLPGFNLALGLEKAREKGIAFEFYKTLYDVSGIKPEDIPEGKTLKGMIRMARLARHMALQEGRRFEYNDDYFYQDYPEEWASEDEKKFAEWYQKGVSRAVKIKDVPKEDLRY